MSHKIRTHHWHQGRLVTKEFKFATFEEALDFAGSIEPTHAVKIYDDADQIVHTAGPNIDTATYA